MALRGWIDGDESADDMLSRLLTERSPVFLLPPLHRLPLRVGNVLELVGPSSSAKTQILIQAAISCILPREWNGVHYGGLGRLAMFIDLDCRFDVSRLADLLKHRIVEANGLSGKVHWEQGHLVNCHEKWKSKMFYEEELFALCMRRFLYVRCYDSFEFLATLKTLHYRLKKESEAHGTSVHFLLIDSIGAFHWVDRACRPLPLGAENSLVCWPGHYSSQKKKSLSLQCVSESVVQEVRNLLMVHPMVVIATKTIIMADKNSANEVKWNSGNSSAADISYSKNVKSGIQHLPYHEYMPSVWQSFVTHRIVVRATGKHCATSEDQGHTIYLSEWLLPPLKFVDKFAVGEAGIFIVS